MRIAVVSDIHANLVALEMVLTQIDELTPDALWCLGDTVGYGPEPQACADLIRQRADLCLAGNHDLAVTGGLALDEFNPLARFAAEWQREHLTAEAVTWLAGLSSRQIEQGITLAHASPRDPVWEYIDDNNVAAQNADYFDTRLCLIGHSHLAAGWRLNDNRWYVQSKFSKGMAGEPLDLEERHRWLLNPGSVGQPRDKDPRASFALLDTEANTWTWHRHEYDVAAVEAAILAAGLPPRLGERLYFGW